MNNPYLYIRQGLVQISPNIVPVIVPSIIH